MTKQELLNKYNRVANDPSQLQSFVVEMIEAVGGGSSGMPEQLAYRMVRNAVRLQKEGDDDASVISGEDSLINTFMLPDSEEFAEKEKKALTQSDVNSEYQLPLKLKIDGDVFVCCTEQTSENSWDIYGASVNGLYIAEGACAFESDGETGYTIIIFGFMNKYDSSDQEHSMEWWY